MDCWEFKKCGRELGGTKVRELGVCPAAIESRADGINNGTNGGRACWAITGTFCQGKVQGAFVDKVRGCATCDFFEYVLKEEGKKFQSVEEILKKLPLNCWEFKKCGRAVGGEKLEELGVCPAAIETKTNGINNGTNGGRACWAIAGTLCTGEAQGTFVDKLKGCLTCDFFEYVQRELGKTLKSVKEIQNKLL